MGLLINLPIIPLAIPWEAIATSSALVDEADYGQGKPKLNRRSTIVRPELSRLPVEVGILNHDELDAFLVARRGKPFRIDEPRIPSKAWRCMAWRFVWVGPGVWTFSTEFEEVGGWI